MDTVELRKMAMYLLMGKESIAKDDLQDAAWMEIREVVF